MTTRPSWRLAQTHRAARLVICTKAKTTSGVTRSHIDGFRLNDSERLPGLRTSRRASLEFPGHWNQLCIPRARKAARDGLRRKPPFKAVLRQSFEFRYRRRPQGLRVPAAILVAAAEPTN